MILLAFGSGIVLWTLAEYLLHRFAGHVAKGRVAFSREHLKHHADLNYFERWVNKIPLALLVWVLVACVMYIVMALGFAVATSTGFVAGWYIYERTHQNIHEKDTRFAYSRFMRCCHFYHHFKNPWVNHGVTTHFWDLVFRTYEKPEDITIPNRHVDSMVWMRDGVPAWASGIFRKAP